MNSTLFKHIFKRLVTRHNMKKGMNYISASYIANGIIEDFARSPHVPLRKRIKNLRAGYYSGTVQCIEKGGHDGYIIPELKYYQLHPINGQYSKWIDNKITLRYILAPFKEYLPKYYFQLEKGDISILPDYKKSKMPDIDIVLKLLHEKKSLACKTYNGTGGEGFKKLEYMDGKYLVNNMIVTKEKLTKMLKNLETTIITEYVESEDFLKEINPYSTSTVRLLTVRVENETYLAYGFLRFGTKDTGTIDNMGSGGLMSAIDVETGRLITCGYGNRKSGFKKRTHHPDTNKEIKGQLRNWDLLISKIKEMGNYHPQLISLGYDIAITNDGFKVIEINSLQDLLNAECYMSIPTNKIYGNFMKERIEAL